MTRITIDPITCLEGHGIRNWYLSSDSFYYIPLETTLLLPEESPSNLNRPR